MFTTLTNWLRPSSRKPSRRTRIFSSQLETLEERAVMDATYFHTAIDTGGQTATATVTVNVVRFQTQPVDIVAIGAGPGTGSKVRLYNAKTGVFVGGFSAYAPEFTGGVSVAVADVNGDGVSDIVVGAGPGGGPHIQVVDGNRINLLQGVDQVAPPSALLANFFGYDFAYRGGVQVATGDVNGDGKADIILGTGPGGGAHVRVISGAKVNQIGQDWQPLPSAQLANFLAYDPSFRGGVQVAVGDVNGDGYYDVLAAAGPGGTSHIKAFSGRRLIQVGPNGPGVLLASFYGYDPNFHGGAVVAAGDFNGDGLDDFIVGAGPGGGPHVKVFSALNLATPIASFFAFGNSVTGGTSVAYRMRSGGAAPVLVVGTGSGAASQVNTYVAPNFVPVASTDVFDPGFLGGVDVG